MGIHDLSMPVITDHFRRTAPREATGDYSRVAPFRVTRLTPSCHAFTHMDARRPMLPGAETIEATPLEDVAEPAFVLDLPNAASDEEFGETRIEAARRDRAGTRIIFRRTKWDIRRNWREPSYWREAPRLSRDAAEALGRRKPSTSPRTTRSACPSTGSCHRCPSTSPTTCSCADASRGSSTSSAPPPSKRRRSSSAPYRSKSGG